MDTALELRLALRYLLEIVKYTVFIAAVLVIAFQVWGLVSRLRSSR